MNMAELRYLQGDSETALAHWSECKNEFLTLFFTGPHLLAPGPPHVIKRLLSLAAQKFVSDIAADAFQHARIRSNAAGSRTRGPQGGPAAARVCALTLSRRAPVVRNVNAAG